MNFNKLWSEYGIGAVVVLLLVAYGIHLFANYLTNKSSFGSEGYDNNNGSESSNNNNYGGNVDPKPVVPAFDNDFEKVNYSATKNGQSTNNPNELLPKTSNSWGQLNPKGSGELSGVNLLSSGYHYGIDTVGQSRRNPNYQIRSEPPNPTRDVGPWNQTTIQPDKFQVPFELNQGPV
jgi:hypothetical protein